MTERRSSGPSVSGRGALVQRFRLLTVMAGRFDRRLTVVVGAAGFGKSTLLAQAVEGNGVEPVGTDVVVRCVDHMLADDIDAAIVTQLTGAAARAGSRPADAILAAAPTRVAIVFDDAQRLGPDATSHIAALLDDLPANGHLVISSREDPSIPMHGLIADGLAAVIDESDLRFSQDEVAEFGRLRGIDLEVEHVGGWPALAEMAAAAGEKQVGGFVWEQFVETRSADDRAALEALVAVGALDDLLASSLVAPDVTAATIATRFPLVALVDGIAVPHDLWEHHLLPRLDTAKVRDLRVRAAELEAGRGDLPRAIDLLVAAAAWDSALEAIRELWQLRGSIPWSDAARWWAAIPSTVRTGPTGTLLEGATLAAASPERATAVLADAVAGFRDAADTDGEVAALTALGSVARRSGDTAALFTAGQRAMELADGGVESARPLAALSRGFGAHLAGDFRSAVEALDGVDGSALPGEWPAVRMWMLAGALLGLGRPHEAARCAERVLDSTDVQLAATASNTRAWALLLDGHGDRAVASAITDLDRFRGLLPIADLRTGLWDIATGAAYVGDEETARDLLAEAESLGAEAEHDFAARASRVTAEAALDILTGDEAAAAEALTAEIESTTLGPTNQQNLRTLALGYVLVPSVRAPWDAAPLAGCHAATRTAAAALVAARGGDDSTIGAALGDGAPPALLPAPWVLEVGLYAAAAGTREGVARADAVAPRVRSTLMRIAGGPASDLRKAARDLIRRVPAVPRHSVALRVLGPCELEVGGAPVTGGDWKRERVRALTCFLVTHPTTTRDAVGDALWPDLDPEAADRNLRVTLSYLQRVLDPERASIETPYFVRQEAGALRLVLGGRLTVDAERFDDLLDQAATLDQAASPHDALDRYAEAIGTWRGTPLADVGDAAWAAMPRHRLVARYVGAAVRTADLLIALGRPAEAVDIAVATVETEPWSEAAHRALAEAHHRLGDRAAALRVLDRCLTVAAELDVAPEPATHALAVRLGRPQQMPD